MDLSLERFEARLAGTTRQRERRGLAPTRAAVAAVLRFERESPEVLLMKRAERRGDRWSGQISLPGGRAEPQDSDLVATAVRETHEEVGLDLDATARLIGRLPAVRAIGRGRVLPMAIAPFVFVQTGAAALELGDEAVAAFWLPLDRAARGELSDRYTYELGPVSKQFPCWRFGDHVVWGLTFRMLNDLLERVR